MTQNFRLITEIYSDSLYEMITTPVPIASLVEDTPPNFLTEVENVSFTSISTFYRGSQIRPIFLDAHFVHDKTSKFFTCRKIKIM